jgi:hypothetical protein
MKSRPSPKPPASTAQSLLSGPAASTDYFVGTVATDLITVDLTDLVPTSAAP